MRKRTLRSTQRVACVEPLEIEDCYVDLVIAIFRRAKSDLRHPGYSANAQQWLKSPYAAWYAGMLGVEIGKRRK